MRSVNIAALKNELSRHLNEVRQGEELLTRDRNAPIAKIVPLQRADELQAEELALVAAGKLRCPKPYCLHLSGPCRHPACHSNELQRR